MGKNATVFALMLCTSSLGAEETPADLLARAWEEYGLQAFSNADALFADAARIARGEERWQAQLGRAQIVHYQMPGRDPQAAISLYEELLREVGDAVPWRGQLLARIADCHAELVPAQIDSARARYRQAMDALPEESRLVEETALRYLTTYLQRPDRGEIARGLQAADEFAVGMAATPFASIFHGLCAEMAFFIADYPALAKALDSQYRAGISNVRVKEGVLFRLARLHEVELGDYARAEEYYRRLAQEVPSSQKAHFAALRAGELAIGKLDSDYAPPLAARVEDQKPTEDAR